MPRVYVRKFDWERARTLKKAGKSNAETARLLGVSSAAVHYATNPVSNLRARKANQAWQRTGVCTSCGGPKNRGTPAKLCRTCAAVARRTSIREDTLRCPCCGEWKPDTEFAADPSKVARRGRRWNCRTCDKAARVARRRVGGNTCPTCGVAITPEAATCRIHRPLRNRRDAA